MHKCFRFFGLSMTFLKIEIYKGVELIFEIYAVVVSIVF